MEHFVSVVRGEAELAGGLQSGSSVTLVGVI
jgi:hypothetical protein